MMRLISYYMGEKIENGKNKHVNELEKINECVIIIFNHR